MRNGRELKFLAALLALVGLLTVAPAAAQTPSPGAGACPGLYDPVCARKKSELINYPNACLAANDRATILAKGSCPQACPMIYQPVCAEDAQGVRRNYGNACAATADGARIVRNRRCFLTFGRR